MDATESVTVIRPLFSGEDWAVMVNLLAVRAGRQAEELIVNLLGGRTVITAGTLKPVDQGSQYNVSVSNRSSPGFYFWVINCRVKTPPRPDPRSPSSQPAKNH